MISAFHDGKPDGLNGSAKPDFLCIGAQKSATSWLNKVLLEHPQVFMPPINELHFFDRVDRNAPLRDRQIALAEREIRREEAKEAGADRAYIDYLNRMSAFPAVSEDWYRAAYSWPVASDVKKGDITPSYLELSEKQVAYARRLLGPARLILIVRKPADRLLSQMRMWVGRNRAEEPTPRQWLGIMRKMYSSENRGAYSRGIPLWRAYFGVESLLILPFADIRNDPAATIARVEDHIGLPRFEGFTLLAEPIHVTRKYEIPDKVKRAVVELTSAEDTYIRTEFGDLFYEKTS